MDPYRDNFKIDVLNKLNSLQEEVSGLKSNKTEKSTPISNAIAYNIKTTDFVDMAWGGLLWIGLATAVVLLSIFLINVMVADNIPETCTYEKTEDGTWKIKIIKDWKADDYMSHFASLEEAQEAGKLSGCPKPE